MFGLEPWHIVLLLAVVLVVFGPTRLPEIGKNLGESIREFRKGTSEFGDAFKSGAAAPLSSADPPAASIVAPKAAPEPLQPTGEGPSSTGQL